MTAAGPSARATVVRSLLIYTPVLALVVAVIGLLMVDMASAGVGAGRVTGIVLVSFVGLLVAYQVVQAARDLLSPLVETTGVVERRWSRSDVFIFQNTYIFVERNVFRLSPEQSLEIQAGDLLRVLHSPYLCAVEHIEVVEARSRTRSDD